MTFLRMSCRGIQYLLRGADDDIFPADTAPRETRQKDHAGGAVPGSGLDSLAGGGVFYIYCARPSGWAFWCLAVIGEPACNSRAGLPPCCLIVDAFWELGFYFFPLVLHPRPSYYMSHPGHPGNRQISASAGMPTCHCLQRPPHFDAPRFVAPGRIRVSSSKSSPAHGRTGLSCAMHLSLAHVFFFSSLSLLRACVPTPSLLGSYGGGRSQPRVPPSPLLLPACTRQKATRLPCGSFRSHSSRRWSDGVRGGTLVLSVIWSPVVDRSGSRKHCTSRVARKARWHSPWGRGHMWEANLLTSSSTLQGPSRLDPPS